ncbi:hypothetical protein C8Q75DRAFT_746912 [Abortiporus biennis]|nr:hypothetical protein C8Q75DRAFT_746912 [Abortiporus biennis]
MLKTLTAPLNGLLLRFEPASDNDNLRNPIPLLRNFSDTLRYLMTTSASWTRQESGEITILPHLRILNMKNNGVPNSATIIRTFPNLSRFAIEERISLDIEKLALLRTSNVEGQHQFHGSGFKSWSGLEEVRAKDISILYALGLACKVDRLVVNYCSSSLLKETQIVLSDMRPTILNIHFSSDAFLGDPVEYMEHMFAYGELTHLTLELFFVESNTVGKMDCGILRAIEIIQHATKLEYLNLSVMWARPYRRSAYLRNILREAARIRRAKAGEYVDEDSDSDDPKPPDPMGEHVDALDHKAIATRIFDVLEFLQVVVLNFQPVEEDPKTLTRGWRVMKRAARSKEEAANVHDIAELREISAEECRRLDESFGHDDDDFYFTAC